MAYRVLMDRFGLTQDQVAAQAGKNRSTVANLLRLLDSPSLGDELGRRGRQRVEKAFSFAAMVAAHETLFEKCAGRG